MAEIDNTAAQSNETTGPQSKKVTRRAVIKGVIAAGAVSSAGYMLRSSVVQAQNAPGSVERLIDFVTSTD